MMKKVILLFVVLYFVLNNNKSKANTLASQRQGVKKFLAKFNVLRNYTEQFIKRLNEDGFQLSEIYDANKMYEGEPLDKVTFYVLDTQLAKFDVLKTLQEIEYISLLVVE